VALAESVDPGENGSKLALKPGPVGSISSDKDTVAVRYTGKTRSKTEGGSAVQLEIDAPAEPAAYEGTVDLVPDDDKAGEVTLKATVRTEWWFFVLAIVLGIVFAALLLWSQHGKRWGLVLRVEGDPEDVRCEHEFIRGLEATRSRGIGHLRVCLDSALLVNQLNEDGKSKRRTASLCMSKRFLWFNSSMTSRSRGSPKGERRSGRTCEHPAWTAEAQAESFSRRTSARIARAPVGGLRRLLLSLRGE
jgi:hypothetical protein